MPLYDVECTGCKRKPFELMCHVNELDDQYCDMCGMPLKVLITNSRSKDWFHSHVNENFGLEPVEVRSRNHLKRLCDEYGVISRALGDHRNIKEI